MTWNDHGKRPGPKPKRPKGRQPCTFEGCDRPNFSHGLCSTHNMQKRRGVELRAIRPPRPTAEEGLRWCGSCKQFVDEDQFGWDPTRGQLKRTCRPCLAEYQVGWVEQDRAEVNLRVRLNKYGLPREVYDEMLAEQGGLCAVCDRDRPLDIDHCHKEGHVRALLCGPCNRALGFFEDDPEIVERALAFLRLHDSA